VSAPAEDSQTPAPTSTKKSGVAPRRAALTALEACFFRHQPLDDAFEPLRAKLSPSDAGLAWAICQEVARERLRLKTLKQSFLKRNLPKNAAAASLILDIGLVQLLKMDGAPHAVISTAVDLAKSDKRPAVRTLAKLINGVLRSAQRRNDAGDLYWPPAIKALPHWLVQRWQTQFGKDGAAQLADAFLTPPGLHVTPKTREASAALAAAQGAQGISGSIQFPSGTSPMSLPGFHEGAFWVQDRAATLPARALAPPPGAFCYDLCAAPGGKTMQLAAMGADVMAIDISKDRLAKVLENLKRTGLHADVVEEDLLEWIPPAPAQSVLLDAPCTALGTFQRHPDVVHHRKAGDVEAIGKTQARLLDAAWKAVAPGGALVYAVCSLEPEEGPGQISAFLQRTADAIITPLEPQAYGLPDTCSQKDGTLITAPHFLQKTGGGDGFFIAKLTRKA
jgi:16S rRNA (cytosine967-C5)-methyltransferase